MAKSEREHIASHSENNQSSVQNRNEQSSGNQVPQKSPNNVQGSENHPRLISTHEAAEALGSSEWWLYQNASRLAGCYRLGRGLRWNLSELLDALRVQK